MGAAPGSHRRPRMQPRLQEPFILIQQLLHQQNCPPGDVSGYFKVKSFEVRFDNWIDFEIHHYGLCSNSGNLINKMGKERRQKRHGWTENVSVNRHRFNDAALQQGREASSGEISTQRPDPAPSGRSGAGGAVRCRQFGGSRASLQLAALCCTPGKRPQGPAEPQGPHTMVQPQQHLSG